MPVMAPRVSSTRLTSFCGFHLYVPRKHSLKQGKRLQRLPEVMAGGGEKTRLRDIGDFAVASPPPTRQPSASAL